MLGGVLRCQGDLWRGCPGSKEATKRVSYLFQDVDVSPWAVGDWTTSCALRLGRTGSFFGARRRVVPRICSFYFRNVH
jgi:hypothetical protein